MSKNPNARYVKYNNHLNFHILSSFILRYICLLTPKEEIDERVTNYWRTNRDQRRNSEEIEHIAEKEASMKIEI